jgi:hypothetical protein
MLVPERHLATLGLVPLQLAPALRPSAAEWPVDDLWLVGHRVMREVPRVAAVWQFLVEELRPANAGRSDGELADTHFRQRRNSRSRTATRR